MPIIHSSIFNCVKLGVLVLLMMPCVSLAQKAVKLKPIEKISLSIPEPSDIALAPDGKVAYVVSDNGLLYETDLAGKVLRESSLKGYDFEGVWVDDKMVYVVDERTRKVYQVDRVTLETVGSVEVPYMAGRNKGYEGICYNPVIGKFLLVTEKDPTQIFEVDLHIGRVRKETEIKKIGDISSISFYNDKVYILSDEDHELWELDAKTYKVERKFNLPIINPEGLMFGLDGKLYVVSDDMATLFIFDKLP